MKAFRSVTSRAAVLDRPDVDTDQIIPKQFLKRIKRTGFGEFLFFDWRKDPGVRAEPAGGAGREDPDGRPQLRLRLVAGARAMGARGLRLRAIIAPSYGDIFRQNSLKIGLLPVRLPPGRWRS